MKKLFSTLMMIIPFMGVYGQEQSTDIINVGQPQKQWYGEELFLQNTSYGSNNPVSITSNPYTQINDFKVSYNSGKGSFMPVDGAGKAGLTDVNIYGVKKLKKIAFEGSLFYGVHQLDDSRWNSTVLLSENNPFIIADSLVYYKKDTQEDSIPNNQTRELFNLNGGLSWQIDKFAVGIRANYLVGSKADQSDPRFEAHGARVTINPGFDYHFSDKYSIGLALMYQTYHENISMWVKDNLLPGHETTFLFRELGNYVVEQSGKRRYDGSKFGGYLQSSFTGNRIADFLEVGYVTTNENADDGGTSYTKHGGDYSESTISFLNRLQFGGQSLRHNIIISGGMTNGSSSWYKQAAKLGDFGETLYEVTSKETVQKQSILLGNLTYRMDIFRSQRPSLTIKVNGGYESTKINEYPDEYLVKYSLANAGLVVSKYLYFGKYAFRISADGKMCKDISKLESSFPTAAGKANMIKAYFMPKYEYISAGYWNGGISIDASYKITRKELSPILLKVGGSYHMTKYTGNYNRFDNRTAAEIRTSLTF